VNTETDTRSGSAAPELVLASTSSYRQALLQRLGLPFTCQPPRVDETPRDEEAPEALATRLALAKARAVAASHPDALVIGSDQVAAVGSRLLGKPGGFEAARKQLRACSGRSVHFHTGLALVCAGRELQLQHVEPFCVHFRTLRDTEIDNYLTREQPFDCAGSFKAEGLGISLFRALEGADPTALEGLPLIALCRLLRAAGLDPLGH